MSLKEFIESEIRSFRDKLQLVPFLKIFLAVALGVLAGEAGCNTFLARTSVLLLPAVTLLCILCRFRLPYTMLVLLGISLTFLHHKKQKIPQNRFVQSRVCVVQTPSAGRALLDVEQINRTPVNNQRVLFVYGDELHAILRKGDLLDITLIFESLKSSSVRGKIPYLERGLTLYAHTHPDSIPQKIGQKVPRKGLTFQARSFFLTLRNSVAARLEGISVGTDDKAVIRAALLGERHGLSPATREAYARAGVAHILAISGLHIGMVGLMLNLLLGWVPNYRTPRALKQAAILSLLWFYVLLTGASPSACRAAFMFSILQYAFFYRRSRHVTYNILFAAALFFTLADYKVLWNVGFQLSYLAVFAILLLAERLELVVTVKNRFLRYFTDTVLITLAVQIITAPLVMYYFGSLSIFSIPANMIFTLLLPVLIAAAFIYMAVPNPICRWVVEVVFECYNYTLHIMERIPYAAITGYYLTIPDLLAYLAMIAVTWIYIKYFFKTE